VFDVEGVECGGVGRSESLRGTGALEALRLAFAASGRLTRTFRPIVLSSPAFMAAFDSDGGPAPSDRKSSATDGSETMA